MGQSSRAWTKARACLTLNDLSMNRRYSKRNRLFFSQLRENLLREVKEEREHGQEMRKMLDY